MGTKILIEKVKMLPAPLKKEVEDFVDFLIYKNEKQGSNFLAEETNLTKPVFGSGKGIFGKIADDFDAPIDDMKDYM